MSKLLKVKQVRKRLGKNSDGAVYDLVRKGLIPPGVVVRLGWAIMFNEDALDEFIRGINGRQIIPYLWHIQRTHQNKNSTRD